MSSKTGSAPGKVILSGEYAVLFGFPGLAIPSRLTVVMEFQKDPALRNLHMRWEGIEPQEEFLQRWDIYLRHILYECEHITAEKFHGTLIIRNELPLGKGMGSSTAFLIAMVRCLLGSDTEETARTLENLLNPGNSGIDFAVVWNDRPAFFRREQKPQNVTLPLDFLENAKLFDTGTPHEPTSELVAWVRSREKEVRPALERIGEATQRLLQGDDPLEVMREHHRAQVSLGIVPEHVQEFIQTIENTGGSAKVLGAGARTGGGGMVLALHPGPSELEKITTFPSMKL